MMAVPTSYTSASLADFMRDGVLKEVAAQLGWLATDIKPYPEAVTQVAIDLRVSDVSAATDIGLLRLYARRAIWREVFEATVGDYDFTSGDARSERSMVHKQAAEALEQAKYEITAYCSLPGGSTSGGSSIPVDTYATW